MAKLSLGNIVVFLAWQYWPMAIFYSSRDSVRMKMMYQQGYGKVLEPEHPKTLDSKAYPQLI